MICAFSYPKMVISPMSHPFIQFSIAEQINTLLKDLAAEGL